MNQLTKIIKSVIEETGPITFDEFIELALYDQKYGYYNAGKKTVGKEGDYYTSPCVHPAFGEVIGRFLYKSYEVIGVSNLTIIEMGAGKGYLAKDILNSLKALNPNFYRVLNYIIIEKSPNQIRQGKTLLNDHLHKIEWITQISDLKSTNICGIFISNELVDSFPFHRAKFDDQNLKEIYLGIENDDFLEILDMPSTNELPDYFKGYDLDLAESQEIEINLRAGKWLRDVASVLDKGLVMTIDYGFLAPELFNPTRMRGTYKCLYKHSIKDDPYINIGEQDITAHVDFSNLIRVGESVNLKTVKYTTQGQFLIDWGILDLVEGYASNQNESFLSRISHQKNIAAIKNLFLPELMGDKFKVLIQEKNIYYDLEGFFPESPFKISFQKSSDRYDQIENY